MQSQTSNGKSILIVDDQLFFIQSIEPILLEWGYNVKSYINPVDAISAVKDNEFDLVLCDLKMPCLRGDKLLFQLNRIKPELKCFLITAVEKDDPILHKALKLDNVHGLIPKPISYDRLLKTLQKETPLAK